MCALWETTEGMILKTVEQYLTLEKDGLPYQQIVDKIEAFRCSYGEGMPPVEPGLPGYLRYRLTIEDPGYLASRGNPKADALPDCATPRNSSVAYETSVFQAGNSRDEGNRVSP
jgi:hypothetical protein